VPAEDVEHAWALLGLTVASPDHLALSQADVDGLAAWLKMKAFFCSEGAFGR
jgi:class 3 adenylate cyclase